jgi:PAS domain S-box-containing protein
LPNALGASSDRFSAHIGDAQSRFRRGFPGDFAMTEALDVRRHMEESSLLRAVTETVIDGLITIDARGIINSFNPAAEKILGYRPDEVIGQNVKMLMPEPYVSEHDGYLANYQRTGEAKAIGKGREVLARRKDGTTLPIELGVGEMLVDDKPMFVGIIRDITDRKEREASEVHLRNLLNTIVDGLITIDEAGNVLSANPAAERLFGYAEAEMLGRNIKMLMPEPYHSAHDGYLRSYRETGHAKIIGVGGRDVMARRKDGSTFPMELGVSEMQVRGKRVFAGIIRDISARKSAEAELERTVRALERSNQDLDDFAHIASHDLKEPLRGLANNARFIEEDYATRIDDAGVKRLHRMTYLCQRMERLVDDLLYYSRLGRQELAIKPIDLNLMIKDIKTMMEAALHDENVTITVVEPLPTVVCNFPRVTELFHNLISNGIKYNQSKDKRIEIGCLTGATDSGPPEQVFYVRDNGMGIACEFHKDIFRIFKRLNVEDEAVKGTGIGLTIVKKIVERHHGRIWVDSRLGDGSVFYFTLNSVSKASDHE